MSGTGDDTDDVPRDSLGRSRRRRRGPAPMVAADRRVHRVNVYLNPAELAVLDDLRGGIGRGRYLRTAALETPPPSVPAINLDAWRSLAPVASNLNQLARRVNSGEAPAIAEVYAEIQNLRAAMVGFIPDADEAYADADSDDQADEGLLDES